MSFFIRNLIRQKRNFGCKKVDGSALVQAYRTEDVGKLQNQLFGERFDEAVDGVKFGFDRVFKAKRVEGFRVFGADRREFRRRELFEERRKVEAGVEILDGR